MFVSKFISFRAVDGKLSVRMLITKDGTVVEVHVISPIFYLFSDYGERAGGQSWTVPGTKVVKPISVSNPEKTASKPSDQVTNAACYQMSSTPDSIWNDHFFSIQSDEKLSYQSH